MIKITESDTFPAASIASNLMAAKDRFALPEIAKKSSEWITESINDLKGKETGWHDLSTFWPPRCVEAFSEDNATVFFGAGVSFPAGYPSWNALLIDYFQLDRELIEDEDLKNDPLTLAELAGQQLGNERLQQRLRDVF